MADRIDLDLDPSFRGMLVVGDIHGHVDLMERMIVHARERGLFFVSCGDLVDRGPDSVGCLSRMRDLVAGGRGLWIRGNHEDKLYRALKGRMVKVTTPLQVTMEQLAAHEHGPAIRDGFLEAFEAAPFAVRRGNLFVVHGGFGVRML
ncbi:MAG: metallophosphoesterase, partial [Geminicoccaceae bacterium]|nr:metallophosphoesterase [Geminicoccaceae bacterium]